MVTAFYQDYTQGQNVCNIRERLCRNPGFEKIKMFGRFVVDFCVISSFSSMYKTRQQTTFLKIKLLVRAGSLLPSFLFLLPYFSGWTFNSSLCLFLRLYFYIFIASLCKTVNTVSLSSAFLSTISFSLSSSNHLSTLFFLSGL